MYSQYGEDDLIDKYLDISKPGLYIDIGAGDPIELSNTYKLYEKGWKGLLVEPSDIFISRLLRKREKDKLYPGAILDYNGKVQLAFHKDMGVVEKSWLFYKYKTKLLEEHPKDSEFFIQDIDCITFDKLLEKFPEFIDAQFLSVDVEGTEGLVFKGLDFNKFKPKLLCIEWTMHSKDERSSFEPYVLEYYNYAEQTTGNILYVRKLEDKNLKLHICCGDVYLKGYTNIDITGELVNSVSSNENETIFSNYYKYDFKKVKPRSFLVDKIMDITKPWSFKDDTINEIIIICAIEHFTLEQAQFIVSEMKRVLVNNGRLIIDFPDLKTDIEKYYNDDPNFLMELIYCNHKNRLSVHNWGYTKDSLIKLLGDGWKNPYWGVPVKHDYPVLGLVIQRDKTTK